MLHFFADIDQQLRLTAYNAYTFRNVKTEAKAQTSCHLLGIYPTPPDLQFLTSGFLSAPK